jgi:hypothetical protein
MPRRNLYVLVRYPRGTYGTLQVCISRKTTNQQTDSQSVDQLLYTLLSVHTANPCRDPTTCSSSSIYLLRFGEGRCVETFPRTVFRTPLFSLQDTMANPEIQEQDEATASEQIITKDEEDDNEGEDEKNIEDGGEMDETSPEAPKANGFNSPTKAVGSAQDNNGTPSVPETPGQYSAATTPGPMTPSMHQVQVQVPVQAYGYPPYPYYSAMPGYAPPQTMAFGSSHQPDPMLTNATNPYQYTDVATLHDPAPDTRRNRGGVTEPFPEKLHRMLEDAERGGLSEIVSFFSHGRAFAIHKPRRFVKEIMPKFFRQTRLTSFQRQLNLYGFRRISQGPDNGGTSRGYLSLVTRRVIRSATELTNSFTSLRLLSRALPKR